MLGIDKNEPTIIKGEFAKKLREQLRRAYAGELTEEDIKAKERFEKIKSEYKATWKI